MKEEVTIEGWVARNKDGELHLWNGKPIRNDDNEWWWWSDTHQAKLPESSFPSVTWESGPKKVKIIIKAE